MPNGLRRLAPLVGLPTRWARAAILGDRRPLLAGYKVTHACNLRCPPCPYWRQPDTPASMDLARRTLGWLHKAGARILIIEGGEPMLWRDGEHGLDDLVREAQERFWAVCVVTNGTMGLPTSPDAIWVSVDRVHQGPGLDCSAVLERQMAALEAHEGPPAFANITISAANVDAVPDLVRALATRVAGITIQFYYPYEGDMSQWVPWEQRQELLDELLGMKAAGYPLLDSTSALRALRQPGWRCLPWLVASADPDGTIHHGCYLGGRGEITCRHCGFAAHTEISLAFQLRPGPILTGLRAFGLGPIGGYSVQ